MIGKGDLFYRKRVLFHAKTITVYSIKDIIIKMFITLWITLLITSILSTINY